MLRPVTRPQKLIFNFSYASHFELLVQGTQECFGSGSTRIRIQQGKLSYKKSTIYANFSLIHFSCKFFIIFTLFLKILPWKHSLLNKIPTGTVPTFLVLNKISQKMFVIAFEKMFFYLDPDPYW